MYDDWLNSKTITYISRDYDLRRHAITYNIGRLQTYSCIYQTLHKQRHQNTNTASIKFPHVPYKAYGDLYITTTHVLRNNGLVDGFLVSVDMVDKAHTWLLFTLSVFSIYSVIHEHNWLGAFVIKLQQKWICRNLKICRSSTNGNYIKFLCITAIWKRIDHQLMYMCSFTVHVSLCIAIWVLGLLVGTYICTCMGKRDF